MSDEETFPRVHPLRQASVFIYGPLVNIDTFLLLFTTTLLAEKLGAGTLVGFIVPAYALVAFWTGLFWGWMADKKGRRPPLVISGVFTILALLLFTLATDPWHLIVASTVRGIGGSAGLMIARVLVADLAPRKALGERIAGFSLAMFAGSAAILWMGIGYGGVLYEIDTRLPFIVAAMAEAVALLIAVFAIPETLVEKSPSIEVMSAEERRLSRTYRLRQGVKEWFMILSRRGVVLYILTLFVGAFVGRGISTLVYPLFAPNFGLTPTQMSITYTISALISLGGLIPAGVLSDRIGRKWPVLFAGFFGALTNFFYTFIPGMAAAGIAFPGFLLINLVNSGALVLGGPAFLAYFFEWLRPKERGRASAMSDLFEDVAVTLGFPLIAWIYDDIEPVSAFYFAAIVGILVTIVLWAAWKEAPLPRGKWKMRKSTIVSLAAGIILAAILLTQLLGGMVASVSNNQPDKTETITWSEEATYYYGNYTTAIFTAVGGAVEIEVHWTYGFAEEVADQTDHIVHIIDVRVGMARVWWELSHSADLANRIFPGRWTWNRWTPEQLNIAFTTVACYDRLKEAEGMAVDQGRIPADWLQVDWSFEAVKYYWNPGERYYSISDQPDTLEILRLEAGGSTGELRAMFEAATDKAEEVAKATDKTVDLQDLRDAIAETIFQQYPNRYQTLADAQSRLEELEAITNMS